METLELEAVIRAVEKIIEEFGENYVYKRRGDNCFYSDEDGNASCLVGQVLSRLAPNAFAQISEFESCNNVSVGIGDIFCHADVRLSDLMITKDAMAYLRNVQRRQDNGLPWGTAHAAALRYIGEVE